MDKKKKKHYDSSIRSGRFRGREQIEIRICGFEIEKFPSMKGKT